MPQKGQPRENPRLEAPAPEQSAVLRQYPKADLPQLEATAAERSGILRQNLKANLPHKRRPHEGLRLGMTAAEQSEEALPQGVKTQPRRKSAQLAAMEVAAAEG